MLLRNPDIGASMRIGEVARGGAAISKQGEISVLSAPMAYCSFRTAHDSAPEAA
jgi:hypothetical protein